MEERKQQNNMVVAIYNYSTYHFTSYDVMVSYIDTVFYQFRLVKFLLWMRLPHSNVLCFYIYVIIMLKYL